MHFISAASYGVFFKKKEDQIYGLRVAEMAKKHSREAFHVLDDPLEAAVSSVLVEIVKEMDKNDR